MHAAAGRRIGVDVGSGAASSARLATRVRQQEAIVVDRLTRATQTLHQTISKQQKYAANDNDNDDVRQREADRDERVDTPDSASCAPHPRRRRPPTIWPTTFAHN
jgi:uncharacterized membrane protein YhiD involved in acid resistance